MGDRTSNGSEIRFPVVRDRAGLLFTFFDEAAVMRTVEAMGDVEVAARGAVMVTDSRMTLGGDRVYVADLNPRKDRAAPAVWIEPRGEWLARVMPKTSLLALANDSALDDATVADASGRNAKTSTRRRPIKPGHRARPANGAQAQGGQAAGGQPGGGQAASGARVVVYSTSWCPSCRAARAFLQQSGVRYAELDVERDQSAAQQMLSLQARYAMQRGSVPLIVVDGRPYQGFSAQRMEAVLRSAGILR